MAAAKVIQMKAPSINALITQARAAWDRADEIAADAQDWQVRTGKLLLEIKGRTKHGEWGLALKKIGRSQQRASELMALAKGTKTVEQQRERTREAMKKTRAKSPSRDGGLPRATPGPGLDSPEIAEMIATQEDELFAAANPEFDNPQEIWINSLSSLCADVAVRFSHWDKHMPGWRQFECPSHVAKLVEEAATALASVTANVAKRDRRRA